MNHYEIAELSKGLDNAEEMVAKAITETRAAFEKTTTYLRGEDREEMEEELGAMLGQLRKIKKDLRAKSNWLSYEAFRAEEAEEME